uniref:GST N-terminal domain-containing protein n=1 Tax=Macrostomum lignano TaxID=282301 RepID=A0A1I8JMN9_9PLAT
VLFRCPRSWRTNPSGLVFAPLAKSISRTSDSLKSNGPSQKKNSPTGVMPFVDTGDKSKGLLAQSGAIARYYAKKAGGPKLLSGLVDFLKQAGGQYFAGKSLSLADLGCLNILDSLANMPDLLAKYPELTELKKRVLAGNAKLAEYIKNRPDLHRSGYEN